MKKELLLASLMLTSQAAMAASSDVAMAETMMRVEQAKKVAFSFRATKTIEAGFYDANGDWQPSTMLVSLDFVPIESAQDFELINFNPIYEGDREFELIFRTENLTTGENQELGQSYYYAVQKQNKIFVYDCDSSQVCNANVDDQTFAILEFENKNKLKFEYIADHFITPYVNFEGDVWKKPLAGMEFVKQK